MATGRFPAAYSFFCFTALGFLLFASFCASESVQAGKGFIPVSYKLQLNFTSEFSQFYGYLNFTFKPVQARLKKVTLDSMRLAIPSSRVRLFLREDELKLADVKMEPNGKFMTVTTNYSLIENREYKLTMYFFGDINEDAKGLFRSYYKDGSKQQKSVFATNLNPAYARYLFPCVDNPSVKSDFHLTVIHNNGSKVISNAPIKSTEKSFPTHLKTTFEEIKNIPTHLLAFVVGDFEELYRNATLKLTTLGLVSSKHRLKLSHTFAAEAAAIAEELTGVSVPRSNLNLVLIPDLPVNIFGPGLLMLSEGPLLFEEGLPTRVQQDILLRMAGYVSTSWAGLYLWPASWQAKWITSGFANLLKYKISALVRPEWDLDKQQVADQMTSSLSLAGHSDLLAFSQVDENCVEEQNIDDKAASIFLMAENFLNKSSFWKATRKFFSESTDHAINEMDFVNFFEFQARADESLASGVTIWNVFRSWSTQAGYPVIDVMRNYTSGRVIVTQGRFFSNDDDRKSSKNEEKWWVPISAKVEKQPWPLDSSSKYWLAPREPLYIDNVAEKDEWIYFNVNRGGPYRVNYDLTNWKKLIGLLKSPYMIDLPVLTRGNLVSDALALGRAGLLPWESALEALSYLSQENDYIPWKSVLPEIIYIKDRMRGTPTLDLFKKYLSRLFKKALLDSQYMVGIPHANMEFPRIHVKKLLKETIFWWACWSGMTQCEDIVRPYFLDWVKDQSKSPPVDVFTTVMCMGVQKWDKESAVFLKSQSEKSGPFRNLYLTGLTCSRTPVYVLMGLIHGAEVRRDLVFFSEALLQYSDNTPGLLEILSSPYYFPLFRSSVRSDAEMIKLLKLLLTKINTDAELTQLQNTVRKNARDWMTILEPSYRIARYNVAWKNKHLPEIENWLKTKLNKRPLRDGDLY